MNTILRFASVPLLALAACTSTPPPSPSFPWEGQPDPGADLVLMHGRIATMAPGAAARPSATALAVRGGRIVAVGSDADIMPFVSEGTRRIDLRGHFVMPGFIEGHGHFLGVGEMQLELDLRSAKSWEDIVALVADAVKRARPGEWIRGRGWHQEKWSHPPEPNIEGIPLNDELSRISPDNPVILVHASGHAVFVNAKALDLADIGVESTSPAGGEILKAVDGRPTGLLRETAAELAWSALAREPRDVRRERERFRKEVELATDDCLRKGITSFQDAGSPLATIDRFRELAESGSLRLRLWVMARDDHAALRAGLPLRHWIGKGDGFLTVGAIKEQIDGALGSHGAWMLAPYADLPASAGLNTTPVADIEDAARIAKENGFQLCVHAIGDRANRETLDVYERVLGPDAKGLDHRWRVEHAQHLDPADIPRFAALGVIASMQSIHCTSDGSWVPQRIGEDRARTGAYVWRSLLDSGAVVSNGTDAPVEDVDPLACLFAAVTRRLPDGRAFHPEQCMTRAEALRSYTMTNAFAAHEEDVKGSLEVGKYADIVVLDRDLVHCADDEIRGAKVLYTIVGGKIAYEAK